MATPVQSGAQSATWYQTAEGAIGATIVDDVNTDWNALPSGKLKDLLNTTYVAAGPISAVQAFLTAFAEAGGSVNVSGPLSCISYWSISSGYPVLNFVTTSGEPAAAYVVRIQTSYSASE